MLCPPPAAAFAVADLPAEKYGVYGVGKRERGRERGERERVDRERERERERDMRLRALRAPRAQTVGYVGACVQVGAEEVFRRLALPPPQMPPSPSPICQPHGGEKPFHRMILFLIHGLKTIIFKRNFQHLV